MGWFRRKNVKDSLPFPGQKKGQGVFLATLPKSGTDFLDNSLMRISGLNVPAVYRRPGILGEVRSGYYPFTLPVIGIGNFDTQFLNATILADCRAAGNLVSTHAGASFYNLMALEQAGVDRLTVTMRDPRDATVSLLHHIVRGGRQQRNNLMQFLYLPVDYFLWPESKQLSHLVRTFLPKSISWIEGWFGAIAQRATRLKINLVFHDHLRQDSKNFVKRVVEFHGLRNVDFSLLPEKSELAHFRKGGTKEYAKVFSQEDLEFSRLLIGNRLSSAYEDAVSAELERAAALTDARQQISSLVCTALMLPNSDVMAEKVCGALKRNGVAEAEGLYSVWQSWLGKADREIFDYPLEIVDQLQALRVSWS